MYYEIKKFNVQCILIIVYFNPHKYQQVSHTLGYSKVTTKSLSLTVSLQWSPFLLVKRKIVSFHLAIARYM